MAGVSRSTTSRVLNDHPSVRPEVRARVRQVMADVGYVPDPVARSLRRGRSGIVGLLIPQPPATVFGDAYFATLVSAVVRAGQDLGSTVAMVLVEDPPGGNIDLVRRISPGGLLDGVLLTASVDGDPLPGLLTDAGVPIMVIGQPQDNRVPSVDVDNEAGGRLSVEHLVATGRRRLAIVAGPAVNASARSRVAGAQGAVANTPASIVVEMAVGEFSIEAGRRTVAELVADVEPGTFDGLVAGSDAIAYGAMQALAEHGLRVPKDVAVVGFDDLDPAKLTTPNLTTIRQPIRDVARLGLTRLQARVAGHADEPPRQVLDVELVVRGSTVGTVRGTG